VPTAAYPCITWTDGIKVSSTRVENGETEETVSIHHCCYEEVSTLLSNRLVGGGVAGIIVNTVSKAQQFYSSLTKSLDGTEVKLFHSRFTAYDRKVREADLIHRIGKGAVRSTGLKLVIVGTQVLEQSLDIDFDILITDLAPVDLLIQRMGRLHRHQRVRPELMELPTMVVLDSDCSLDKGSEQIYGRWPLLIAKRLFHGSKINKRDTSTMVNAAYDDSSAGNDEEMRRAWDEYQKLLKRKQKKAKAFLLDGPDDWSESDTIDGLLDTDLQVNEMSAAASVRDGIRLPNAIVVMKQGEEVTLLPWVRCKQLSSDILRQQLVSLPSVFRDKQLCAAAEEWCRHNVNLLTGEIKELVGNETVLILDENLSCNLCGYKLSYHKESGLVLEGRA
jgi:CRISPR-associated endonuclease/helicase Cas3